MLHATNIYTIPLLLLFFPSIFQINAVETIALKNLKEQEESQAFFLKEDEAQIDRALQVPAALQPQPVAQMPLQPCLTRYKRPVLGLTWLAAAVTLIIVIVKLTNSSSDESISIQPVPSAPTPAPAPKPSPPALPACNLPPEVFTSTNSTFDPECLPDDTRIAFGTQRLLPLVKLTAPFWSQSVSVEGISPIYISTHLPGVQIEDIKQELKLPWWVEPSLYPCLPLNVIFCFKEHPRVPLQNTTGFFYQNMRAFYRAGIFKEGSLNAICEAALGPCARNLTANKTSHNPLSTKLKLTHVRAHTKHSNRALNSSHALMRGNQGRKR